MSLDVITTAAFGRRTVTRAQIEAQIAVRQARARADEAGRDAPAVHKWTLLRQLGEIREGLGLSDRALGVLSALLSFHPETALTFAPDAADGAGQGTSANLVVFPSNKALTARCNGMSEATLRRHLAALVEAGLIIRRDSPNGKRFARRETGSEGGTQIYGFDLAPLVARGADFEAMAEALRSEQRRVRLLRERINLLRRDLTKRIAFALDEGLCGDWETLRRRFLDLCTPLRRVRDLSGLAGLTNALERLFGDANAALEHALHAASNVNAESCGDAAHFGRRITESNPHQFSDFEPASNEAGVEEYDKPDASPLSPGAPPLGLVREACRDLAEHDFSGSGLATWRGFVETAARVRPMLGISPDAWREAVETFGERDAAVAVAFILQRCEHSSEATRHLGADGRLSVTVNGSPAIRSPGGYLRALTAKARADAPGEGRAAGAAGFGLWPAILAHLAQRAKAERAARC